MQKLKLSTRLASAYRTGWRVYLKKDLRSMPVIEIREMFPFTIVEEDDNFPHLVFIRDKKHWELNEVEKGLQASK